MSHPTLVLTGDDVRALLGVKACIDAVEQALVAHERGLSLGPTSLGLTLPLGSFHVKAAGLARDDRAFIVAKANVNLPGNPGRTGRPTIQGVLTLLDAGSGAPLAVMDAIAITSLRTAAVSAVAARHLAAPDATTAAILGCGEQGEAHAHALAVVRPIDRLTLFDLDADRARVLAGRLGSSLGIDVRIATTISDATAGATMIATCTTATAAIVGPDLARPGVFIAAVGADNPAKQEIHPAVLATSRVVVDSIDACAAGGDLHHAIAAGAMTRDQVHAELSAIVAGRRPGRTSADQVFVFDSVGTALQDVAAAAHVYDRAIAAGRGVPVVLAGR